MEWLIFSPSSIESSFPSHDRSDAEAKEEVQGSPDVSNEQITNGGGKAEECPSPGPKLSPVHKFSLFIYRINVLLPILRVTFQWFHQ
jgi:hypothetical protein